MNRTYALACNNLVNIKATTSDADRKNTTLVGTLLNNLAYYGYTVNNDVIKSLMSHSIVELTEFWTDLEDVLKEITGTNRNMAEAVVYKNFPKEVLNKTQAEYWFSQVLMYLGVPNEYFTETPIVRNKPLESKTLKVLSPANELSLTQIYESLIAQPSAWNHQQWEVMQFLLDELKIEHLKLKDFSFKTNGIMAINSSLKNKTFSYEIKDATDVLRLAAAMSEQDISLRNKVAFRSFSRQERKQLLSVLDETNNLENDVAARQKVWKILFSKLHPGDYNYQNVKNVYDTLYKKNLKTHNSLVEAGLTNADSQVLDLLKARPGEFIRRLHKLYNVFGEKTISAFKNVVPKLETIQLLKLNGYLLTVNNRKQMTYAPNGNWSKLQIVANTKNPFLLNDLIKIVDLINNELKTRMEHKFPQGVTLDPKLSNVKLQTNDQKLASYGRGTTFDIPKDVDFVRTASYWQNTSKYHDVWYDNGWNLFDKDWKPVGTCCWNHNNFEDAAIFSGDPTTSNSKDGRACQMIDLYLDKLEKLGVKYAVWNVLAYSNISFDDTDEVLATLQWGTNAETGELYEPSRAQMVFPLKGKNLTKYVAYLDVSEHKLVYLDANLPGQVSSAANNTESLETKMPAYIEYLQSLPSVADLFINVKEGNTKILFSDENVELSENENAYVFQPTNPSNTYTPIDVNELLMS